MLARLERSRQALLDAVRDVSEEAAALSPGDGRWSVLDCVEHVAVSERLLLKLILAAAPSDDPASGPERDARIVSRGLDRTRQVAAPDPARPRGRFHTLADALGAFVDARERTVAFVEQCHDDLRLTKTSHPIMGAVNGHEMLLVIAVHAERHAAQIVETTAAANNRES